MPDRIVRLYPTNVRFWIEPEIKEDLAVDFTCKFSHSHQLRCAVNPSGPCKGCGDYEARVPEDKSVELTVGAIDQGANNKHLASIRRVTTEDGVQHIRVLGFSYVSLNLVDNRENYSVGYTCELNERE